MFAYEDILAAYARVSNVIYKTPVMTSASIDELCSKKVFFKCEHLQKTGSFKARGALNAVKIINSEKNGNKFSLITHSSGNHGQALAWAARHLGVNCTVVVPNDAPASKIKAMQAYGANLILCIPKERQSVCDEVMKQGNYEYVDPHNDYRVMAGQGTIAVEFLEQVPDLDAILVCVGGGGFAAGIAVASRQQKKDIKVFCAEPEGKKLGDSLDAGERLWRDDAGPLDTIADGVRVLRVGPKCFPQLKQNCERTVLTVNDDDIVKAMELIYIRLKQTVEPTAAVALAGLLKHKDALKDCKRVGVILCGGNVDIHDLPFKNGKI